ncbi:hypothetical protein D3C81_2160170 [compost metagenome]
MALVSPSNTVTVKLNLNEDVAEELTKYSEWAKAPRSKVVRVALERLFKEDAEWIEFREEL